MRRVLVDTNVLISALVFPEGVAAHALMRVVVGERLVMTEWILDESREVVRRKWPALLRTLEALFERLDYELLPVGSASMAIRDVDDQPILDAAVASEVDVILTGDKDFHALNLEFPKILAPRTFLGS